MKFENLLTGNYLHIYHSFNIAKFGGISISIRNLWSLEPGECIVAEELMRKLKKNKCEVYFPLRDTGIDLIAVRRDKHISIQVKESRYYEERKSKEDIKGHTWHTLGIEKFKKNKEKIDFYIFITYLPIRSKDKLSYFKIRYLIVPTTEFEKRIEFKKKESGKKLHFYFHFDGSKVHDIRGTKLINDNWADYSNFLDAWQLIDEALS